MNSAHGPGNFRDNESVFCSALVKMANGQSDEAREILETLGQHIASTRESKSQKWLKPHINLALSEANKN